MKIFRCDKCGEEVAVLYDLILANGKVICVCRACFYGYETDELLQ